MPRLSIEITPEQHQKLKAIAALKGQSIKEYVINKTLTDTPDISQLTDSQALTQLQKLLALRIAQAEQGDRSFHLKARKRCLKLLKRSLWIPLHRNQLSLILISRALFDHIESFDRFFASAGKACIPPWSG